MIDDAGAATSRETTVLVADDSAVVREIIRDHLERNGYRVLLARDGAEALSIYRREDVHVLVTDLEMPQLDGIELCWLVRAEDDQHRTFCILMTADGDTQRRIEAFDAGADEFLIKPFDMPMLRARVRAGERLTRTHRAMAEMLSIDYLTGVPNRRTFMERLEQAHRRACTSGEPLAVAMFDIDHFKAINDTHGHSNGDSALKLFAGNIRAHLPPGAFLGRMGGEEFCLALPVPRDGQGGCDLAPMVELVERIRLSTAELKAERSDGFTFSFTVSVGVCAAQGTDSVADLLALADESLYFAKRSGRNRTVVHGSEGVAIKARFYVI